MTESTSKKFKFTPSKLNAIPPHDPSSRSTNNEVSDTEVVGLKLLISKSGGKSFLFRYVSPVTRKKSSISLNRWNDIDLPTVRNKARKFKVQIADGIDPKLERDQKFNDRMPSLFDFFFDTFLELAKQKKKSWRDDEARFTLHCKDLHQLPIDKITGNHLQQLQLKVLNGKYKGKKYAPATADRVVALMKSVLKQAYKLLDIRYIGDKVSLINPDNKRMRYLDIQETTRLIKASREFYCRIKGNFISLLFLTGCRDKELRTRKWNEIDLVDRKMFISETKNGTSHELPLTPLMVELFRELQTLKKRGNPYVFPGRKVGCHISQPKCAFKLIKERASIANSELVVFHTARHSVASNLINNGVDLLIVQKLLNHKDLSSTQRYISSDEKRIRAGADVLSSLIGDTVPMIEIRLN